MTELIQIEDHVAARHFFMAILAEQPAAEAKGLLGSIASNVTRRCTLVAQWLDRREAEPLARLRGYKALAEATEDSDWEDRAFTTLAQLIESSVTEQIAAKTSTRAQTNARSVKVQAAARIDFGGGWTDTPPYSLEQGGTVLNAAITLRGQHPIMAEATPLSEPKLILESHDIGTTIEPKTAGELLTYANPADPFALQKAALVLKGLVPTDVDPALPVIDLMRELGGGFKLSTATSIPRGSGLGTSSIMAGAVLTCLGQVTGTASSADELFDEVLCLEQMLTTGGGWQDQVGGLTGGIKLVTTAPGLPQHIHVEPVQLSPETNVELASRLILGLHGAAALGQESAARGDGPLAGARSRNGLDSSRNRAAGDRDAGGLEGRQRRSIWRAAGRALGHQSTHGPRLHQSLHRQVVRGDAPAHQRRQARGRRRRRLRDGGRAQHPIRARSLGGAGDALSGHACGNLDVRRAG